MMLRVGMGFDVHRLVAGRKLMLGGVEFDSGCGLEGHSDADVAIHALCDALLGAARLGDIGRHFPPNDPQWKDVSSLFLLKRVGVLLTQNGWRLVNADLTILCEQPKIAPRADEMSARIAAALQVPMEAIAVKGTTTEHLGFTGREEGIAAFAVALVEQ